MGLLGSVIVYMTVGAPCVGWVHARLVAVAQVDHRVRSNIGLNDMGWRHQIAPLCPHDPGPAFDLAGYSFLGAMGKEFLLVYAAKEKDAPTIFFLELPGVRSRYVGLDRVVYIYAKLDKILYKGGHRAV